MENHEPLEPKPSFGKSGEEYDYGIFPKYLPIAFIDFLIRLGIEPNPLPPSLNYETLAKAHDAGNGTLQDIKYNHTKALISFRSSKTLGVPMKARAQLLLSKNKEHRAQGDPSTWIVDPDDESSLIAVTKLLLEKQSRNSLWIGFCITGDWTDALSTHKNESPIVLGHDPDPLDGKKYPINSLEDLQSYLPTIRWIVQQEQILKLARKLARIKNPNLDHFLHDNQIEYIEAEKPRAKVMLDDIRQGETTWEKLDEQLAKQGQPPLNRHDHCLLKMFAQDDPHWKIADLMADENSLTIEIPKHRFTHRGDTPDSIGENDKKPNRITLRLLNSGKLVILAEPENIPYLYPMINSPEFADDFDRFILPKLGPSPYNQVEYMLRLGKPVEEITSQEDLKDALYAGKVDFIADIITGLSPSNEQSDYSKRHPISIFLNNLTPETLVNIPVINPKYKELIINQDYVTQLYRILDNCQQYPSTIISDYDRHMVEILITLQDEWKNTYRLPPSIIKTLEDIVVYGRPSRMPWRALVMLEQQASVVVSS